VNGAASHRRGEFGKLGDTELDFTVVKKLSLWRFLVSYLMSLKNSAGNVEL
jgi:hypothetical protein